MTKLALITDMHFGVRNDAPIFIKNQEKFYKELFFPTLLKNNIKEVVILGDTFDRRKYVNFDTFYKFKKIFFDQLSDNNINLTMIVGNHDAYFKNTIEVNSPDLLLKEYKNITVIKEPKTVDFGKYSVAMIPWICQDNQEKCFNEIKYSPAKHLFGHLEIQGFSMYAGMEAHEGLSRDLFKLYDNVFSGHYHHKSKEGNIQYLGAPSEYTWSDYNDPRGFHLFDLSNSNLEFIRNTNTLFEKLVYDEVTEINLKELNLQDKFVKLIVQKKTDFYKYDLFVKELMNCGIYDLKIVDMITEVSSKELSESVDIEDTLTVLKNYVENSNLETDKNKVSSYLENLYIEAVNFKVE